MSVAITRHLPGKATQRDIMGRVKFYKGRVESVSLNSILIKTESRMIGELGYTRLIGETYIYWCPRCQTSVWEVERVRSQGACPFCRNQLSALQPGDRVKLHFRVGIEKDQNGQMVGGGAAWWGEKVT